MVNIKSLKKEIKFVINKDIKVSESENEVKNTKIIFNQPNTQIVINYDELEQKIRDHFIAYFKLLNREVTIKIFENKNIKKVIRSSEIPEFETINFKIRSHEFILDYVFNDNAIKTYDGFYCAGDRVVIRNSHLEAKKKFNFFKNINVLFLLSSKYFNNNVNETRDDLTIMPKRTNEGLFHDLSWQDIHVELANQIKEIARKYKIDIDGESKKNLHEARQIAPYLAYYLNENENGLSSDDLIHIAIKELNQDKETLRNNEKKVIEDFDKILGMVTQSELAEYIFDRQKKIELLKQLTNDKTLEKEIHNLFMKKYTKDEDKNYRSNNLWLFDDRFMSYDKVFSESKLKDIFPKLVNNLDRPDIISIVSNTFEKDKITDIVLIELKRPSDKITPAEAQRELRSYADYINHSRQGNKIRIWAYAFLKFNEDTERDLMLDEYNQIPTQSRYPIYYKFSNTTNIIINFLDYSSVASDADTRNETFMKILNGETMNEQDNDV